MSFVSNNKGQVSAPFELFVAIIIMTFVIIIGIQMLNNIQAQVCMASVDKELTEFKSKIEDTANNMASNKFYFAPQRCFNESKAKIKIETLTNTKQCSAKCGTPIDRCFTIMFYTPDVPNGYKDKCLNLPTYTSFLEGSGRCQAIDDVAGYDVIDPRDAIKLGQYVTRNIAEAGDTYPKMCVFYKPN
jgi:hypothetical protein